MNFQTTKLNNLLTGIFFDLNPFTWKQLEDGSASFTTTNEYIVRFRGNEVQSLDTCTEDDSEVFFMNGDGCYDDVKFSECKPSDFKIFLRVF